MSTLLEKVQEKGILGQTHIIALSQGKMQIVQLLSGDKTFDSQTYEHAFSEKKTEKARSFKRKTILQKRTREYLKKKWPYKSCPPPQE